MAIQFDLNNEIFGRNAIEISSQVEGASLKVDSIKRMQENAFLDDFDKRIIAYSKGLIMFYEKCKRELVELSNQLELVKGKRIKKYLVKKDINKIIAEYSSRQEKLRNDIDIIRKNKLSN